MIDFFKNTGMDWRCTTQLCCPTITAISTWPCRHFRFSSHSWKWEP